MLEVSQVLLTSVAPASLAILAANASAAPIVPHQSPKLRIEPLRMSLLRERKQVFDIPRPVVNLARPPSWTAATPDRSGPPSALAIQRTRPMTTTPCATFYDYVDLTVPRRNGFRLVRYEVAALPPPAGYGLQSPAEALAIDTSARDTPTNDLSAAGQIRIRPPLHVHTMPLMSSCSSRYRLSMTLEGPRGMNPFAGAHKNGGGSWRDRRW